MKFIPQTWNDVLSLLVILGVPILWVFGGLTGEVVGATIMGWTMVLTYYFRKRPGPEKPPELSPD